MRALTDDEIPLIVPLAEHYLAASQLPIVFDGAKVVRVWNALYQSGAGELCGHFHESALVGVFGVHVMDSSFGTVQCANEWIWWMEPEYRTRYDGMALLEWAESWARQQGVGLQVGAYDCLYGAVLARLYARRGYQRRGAIFTRFW